jgi:hypothetical protein
LVFELVERLVLIFYFFYKRLKFDPFSQEFLRSYLALVFVEQILLEELVTFVEHLQRKTSTVRQG